MEYIAFKLTILFEPPFWIGVYELNYDGLYEVCKITFGSEPKDYEVYDFLLKNWNNLNLALQLGQMILHLKNKSIQSVCNV